MSNRITKEIRLDNLIKPDGVTIQYAIWTVSKGDITFAEANLVVAPVKDYTNLTSKVFANVFEIGEVYYVKLRLVYNTGPSIESQPMKVLVTDDASIYELYPIPSVVISPTITLDHILTRVPVNNINATTSAFNVKGNALHDYSNWWLTDDENTVVWSKLEDRINLTNIVISDISLDPSKMYTLYCVHVGTNNDMSSPGFVSFTPYGYPELELNTDLQEVYYQYGIKANLLTIPANLTNFEYVLYGDGVVSVASVNNTTGIINTGVLSTNYDFFTLKIRATIGGIVYGWLYYKITPKNWTINSTLTYTTNVNQHVLSNVPIKGIKGETLGFNKSFQLPNGDILLKTRDDIFSVYGYNSVTNRFSFKRDFILPSRTSKDTTRLFVCKPLANFKLLMVLDNGDSALIVHIYNYNPNTSELSLDGTVNLGEIGLGLGIVFNDVYVVDSNTVYLSTYARHMTGVYTVNPEKNIQLYSINLTTKVATLIKEGISANYIGTNLLQTNTNKFISFGGWSHTNNTTVNPTITRVDINAGVATLTDITATSNLLSSVVADLTIPSYRNFITIKLSGDNSLYFYPKVSNTPVGNINLYRVLRDAINNDGTKLLMNKHTSDISGIVHLDNGNILILENNLKTMYIYE